MTCGMGCFWSSGFVFGKMLSRLVQNSLGGDEAVAQKMAPTQNGLLVTGNKDQNLRNPDSLIRAHSQSVFSQKAAGSLVTNQNFINLCACFGTPLVGSKGSQTENRPILFEGRDLKPRVCLVFWVRYPPLPVATGIQFPPPPPRRPGPSSRPHAAPSCPCGSPRPPDSAPCAGAMRGRKLAAFLRDPFQKWAHLLTRTFNASVG